ncbi:MAG: alpha-mannosidase, partial [Thermotogaceae bacterium]|nr:alpha-mannosidase [Thermotogaceae bacterium]
LNVIYYLRELIRLHKKVNGYEKKHIEENLKRFFSEVIPGRAGDDYLKSLTEDEETKKEFEKLWSPFREKLDKPVFDEKFKKILIEKFKKLKSSISILPKPYREAYLFANTHIDYAWLWPIDETKRKILRTFSNAANLLENYDFSFVQSSAQMYEDVEKLDPYLFEKIKKLVNERKWQIVGGSWIEHDCNLVPLEALIRQYYYAQKYFKEKFGEIAEVGWLPDVFGMNWNLPQILVQAGIKYLFHPKISWSDIVDFPYKAYIWRGIDGSEVIVSSTPTERYDGDVTSEILFDSPVLWKAAKSFLITYGYGDGGGGPSFDMIKKVEVSKELPLLPIQKSNASIEDYFKALEREKLPTWDGEIYLYFHRGTYTSQSLIKKLHFDSTISLYFAEFANALADENYQEELDTLWKEVLVSEFHDILPGTSVKEVYDDVNKKLEKVIKRSKQIVEESLRRISSGDSYSVLNLSSFDHNGFVIFTEKPISFEGATSQKTYDGRYIHVFPGRIEAFSWKEIKAKNEEPKLYKTSNDMVLENEFYKVEISNDGTVSMLDKEANRDLFKEKGNILMLYKDVPAHWDAWEIEYDYDMAQIPLEAKNVCKIEDGPARQVIRIEYESDGYKITQDVVLTSNIKRIDFRTEVVWKLKRTLLRVLFPLNILSRKATYALPGGVIERSCTKNTAWDIGMFEVPSIGFAQVSQGDFTVVLMSKDKFGYSCKDGVLGLSLLRGPVFPDYKADEGKHVFTYSITSGKPWKVYGPVEFERYIKNPFLVRGRLNIPEKFLKIQPKNFILTSFRKTGKDIEIRLHEALGTQGKISLEIPERFSGKLERVNILHETMPLSFDYSPFKVLTFLLRRNLR